jgi:hypothetical protein
LQRKPSFFPSRAAIAERIVDNAKVYSRSLHAVIRVYDDAGNVIETHQHKGGVYLLASFGASD